MQGQQVISASNKNLTCLIFEQFRILTLLLTISLGLSACGGGNGGLPDTAPPDTSRPTVQSIIPALNETDVSLVGTRILVTFNEALEEQSFFNSNVLIQEIDSNGSVIPLTEVALDSSRPLSFDFNTNTLTIRPTTDSLFEKKEYQILLQEFEDKEGNLMVIFKSRFSTSTPPTITSISPPDGAIPVSRAESITIQFNEIMNETSLKNGFELIETPPNSTSSTKYKFSKTSSPLQLSHSVVNNKSVATYTLINPDKTPKLFTKTTKYTVSLSPTATEIVTDLKGTPLAPVNMTFSTGVSDKTGSLPTKPGIVEAVSSTNPDDTSIYRNTVSWPIENTKAYYIYVSVNDTNFIQIAPTTSPLTTKSPFFHEPVNLGDKYVYAISAIDIIGSGQNITFGPESKFSLSNPVIPREAIASINVTATAGPVTSNNIADGAVQLTWNTVVGNKYYIYVSKAGGNFVKLLTTPITATSNQLIYPPSINSYKPGNDVFYQYGITLVNATTQIESALSKSNIIIPFAAPANVTAVAGDKQATVRWTKWVNVPGVSYSVFAKTGTATTTPYTEVVTGLTTAQYVHGSSTPLINGTSYSYKVVATSIDGTVTRISQQSQATPTVTPSAPATPPAAPANFSAVAGNASVKLTWSIPIGTSFNYKIYIKQGTANYSLKNTLVAPTIGSFNVTGLTNTNYTFQISAVDTNIEGAKSTSLTVTPTVTVVATKISAWNHSCTINDGTLWCWGDNSYGQIGVAPKSRTQKTVQVPDPTIGRIGTAWIEVATGERHTCGIRNTGEMYCWGYAGHGQLGNGSTTTTVSPKIELVSNPTSLGTTTANWTNVTLGQYYSCGLHKTTTDSQLFCWGNNDFDQLGIVGSTSVSLPTAVQTGLDPNNNWIKIEAGDRHTCGIRQQSGNNTLWCWGERRAGKLGDNNQADTTLTFSVPTQVTVTTTGTSPDTDWNSIALGIHHTCGVRSSNSSLWCWGSNLNGQLGNGRSTSYSALQESTGAVDWLDVFANNSQTCGLKKSGVISCWGKNGSGETGSGRVGFPELAPTTFIGANNWSKLALGRDYTCGVHNVNSATPYAVSCWGTAEQYGIGAFTSETAVPKQVGTATDWLNIAFGIENDKEFTLALKGSSLNNTLYGWGLNHYGIFGNNNTSLIQEQFPVSEETSNPGLWKEISGGYHHACGIKAENADNALYCWGRGSYLGQASSSTAVPTRIGLSTDLWLTVDVGARHSCGIKKDSSLWCWGDGSNGEFGAGDVAGVANVPDTANGEYMIQIINPTATTTWSKVSAGFRYTCAIDNAEDLYCWGSNNQGQLGIGAKSTTPKYIPTLVPKIGLAAWKEISAGIATTCAITNVGNQNLYCWGDNVYGTIGSSIAGTSDQTSPTVVTDNQTTPWSAVSINSYHTCARKIDSNTGAIDEGSLWCWGKSDYGQTGSGQYNINFTPSQNIPNQVLTGTYWKNFATGNDSTCAIKAVDNTLWCWGKNFIGQLGINNAWSTSQIPVILP